MCHERETLLKLNFFQLMERHRSWGSVLISIYRLDTHDLKNGNAHMTKGFVFECKFSLSRHSIARLAVYNQIVAITIK